MISQAAIDLIVAAEVSSQRVYEKRYTRPEWPGGASGVTVGIGYDLGYATKEKIQADWGSRLPQSAIDAMKACSGIRGASAKTLTAHVRDQIEVSWHAAMDVFLLTDIPDWTRKVCLAMPKASRLSADCLGALVSLAYNRGASFTLPGDRYLEMRQIRQHVEGEHWDLVDDDIRAMKRLWPNVKGLRDRRDAEAAMFQRGLLTSGAPAIVPKANPNPPPLKPKPKAGSAETGAGASPVVVGGGAAKHAAESGASSTTIILILIAAAAIGVGMWFLIRYLRTRPVLARQKG